jgi:DNA helicase-2/ATP-dependent DNA helicase PcrA
MLNPQQLKAVEKIEGPCLIIAGAGTGKTKTITEKIGFLLEKGFNPERILALTFSNEAASQMKEKAEVSSPLARHVHISTFHSFCAEFIRNHAGQLDVSENFKILEELDGAILLRRLLQLDAGTAKWYANTIGKAKDLGITIEDYNAYLEAQENLLATYYPQENWKAFYHIALVRLRTMHLDTIKNKEEKTKLIDFIYLYENWKKYREFISAWIKYEEEKEATDALDYADLNKLVIDYVQRYGPAELADSYDYIIVDEFQDTNKVQFELLLALTSKHKNITVVGDQNQTVYAFRGAYADNIEKFRKAFGILDVVKLKENYRSSDRILRTAHKIITNNYADPSQSILLNSFDSREGDKVRIIQTEETREQARWIIEEIEKLTTSNGVAYKDIAILYRSHSSATLVKRALTQRGIPYSIAGGNDFFYMPEIKAIVSFLYVLHNFQKPLLQADQAWWKLLHGRFGLSAVDSTRLAEHAKMKRKKWNEPFQEVLYKDVRKIGISREGVEKIQKLTEIIDLLRAKRNHRVSDLIMEILSQTGIAREFQNESNTRSKEALQNIGRLINLAFTFETFHGDDLESFVAYIELIDEMSSGMASAKLLEEESVKLMTIHAAKGLEFDTVFVIDMIRDKFPLTRGGAEPLIPIELNEQYNEVLSKTYEEDKEKETAVKEFTSLVKLKEERRLAYVALTRAKSRLILTLAKDYGGKEIREPSQFLYEIGAEPPWFLSEEVDDLDLSFTYDKAIKAKEGGDTEIDRLASEHKKLMEHALESGDIRSLQYHAFIYKGLVARKPLFMEKSSIAKVAAKEVERILSGSETTSGVKFNPSAIAFSVTSLGTYSECPKRYELKHVLLMPSRDDEEGEGAFGFGSIIHSVLESAVNAKITTREELEKLLAEAIESNKAAEIDTERASRIINVFWERHRNNIAKAAATELYFRFTLENFNFAGKIDRIDDLGNGKVRILDYKTGYMNNDVSKDDRERQLLLYALAVQSDPLIAQRKWIPSELVLEMLEKERPLEFTLKNGLMEPKEGRIKPVSIEDIKKSILETARKIAHSYETSFPVADSDTPCRFCSYKLYCPKWG